MGPEVDVQNGWNLLRPRPFFMAIQHTDLRCLDLVRITGQSIVSTFALSMGHISHTCWWPVVLTSAYHPALLYYEYALTFDLERRLFWSQRSFKQLGSVLFFLNRYCAIIGYAPLVIQKFVLPESPLYLLCNPVHPYRKVLAFLTQTIIGSMLS